MDLIDRLLKKRVFQHAGWPCKSTQSTGAFGAAQITTGGGLEGDGNGITPLHGLVQQTTGVKTAEDLSSVPQPPGAEFAQQVKTVIPIETGHGQR